MPISGKILTDVRAFSVIERVVLSILLPTFIYSDIAKVLDFMVPGQP